MLEVSSHHNPIVVVSGIQKEESCELIALRRIRVEFEASRRDFDIGSRIRESGPYELLHIDSFRDSCSFRTSRSHMYVSAQGLLTTLVSVS